jgi:hypothetical protein
MSDPAFGIYLTRGRQMANAMRLLRGDPDYLAPTALLAVHCAISFNDAVLVRLGGSAFRGQDHRQAAEATKSRCVNRRLDSRGLDQLRELLSHKTDIAYGRDALSGPSVERLCIAANRFETWVEHTLRGIQ